MLKKIIWSRNGAI